MGGEDGTPKTPEWQEPETGVSAHIVRALAREWASKKTYLAAGGKGTTFGGACRSATGTQWARSMVCLMAMQGLGKPGVNFGNLQTGAPLNHHFYFRSEEHTSELQSRTNLVCRLLLEKKKH